MINTFINNNNKYSITNTQIQLALEYYLNRACIHLTFSHKSIIQEKLLNSPYINITGK